MIGRIQGKILEKIPPHILIDCNGVGYEIEVPMTAFYDLPEVGSDVVLLTHLLIREDAQLLFGFATDQERIIFRKLLKVNGIGAKASLSILGGMTVNELTHSIQTQDVNSLTKIPGVGKKTAERLMITSGVYELPCELIEVPRGLDILIESLNDRQKLENLVKAFTLTTNGLKKALAEWLKVKPADYDLKDGIVL